MLTGKETNDRYPRRVKTQFVVQASAWRIKIPFPHVYNSPEFVYARTYSRARTGTRKSDRTWPSVLPVPPCENNKDTPAAPSRSIFAPSVEAHAYTETPILLPLRRGRRERVVRQHAIQYPAICCRWPHPCLLQQADQTPVRISSLIRVLC